jgi:hypothetical protein
MIVPQSDLLAEICTAMARADTLREMAERRAARLAELVAGATRLEDFLKPLPAEAPATN